MATAEGEGAAGPWPRLAGWLALAGGLLLPLAYAPFHLSPLAPLCVACLFALWDGVSPAAAARRGFLFGFGAFLTGTYWTYTSLHVFGKAPLFVALPLVVSLMALMAAYVALAGWLANRIDPRPGLRRWLLVLPSCWALVEWLRGWLFSGFPWLSLGYSQSDTPLGGLAPVAGVFAVSWAVAFTAGALRALLAGPRRRRALAAAAIVGVWVIGAGLRGVPWTRPAGEPIEVSIIQAAVSQDRKWEPEELLPTMRLYRDLTRRHWSSDLIIWPEAAIPALRVRLRDYFAALREEAQRHEADLLAGVIEYRPDTEQYLNGLMSLRSEGGTYYKRHLVPFGEYFPVPSFVRDWMRLRNLPYSDYSRGAADQEPLRVAGQRVAASICYEDLFGAELIYALPAATMLVNVSNDAWFGNSVAPHQHLQIARLRALESGRDMARATNTGISAVIGADGRVRARIPQFETHVLTATVQPREGATPYALAGDVPVVAWSLALLAVAVTLRRRPAPAAEPQVG